jgi:hypothetical protein
MAENVRARETEHKGKYPTKRINGILTTFFHKKAEIPMEGARTGGTD